MTREDLELLADLVADRLRDLPPPAYLSTAGVASLIGMSSAWVRDHAGELGGSRMGDQEHGVLRFDPVEVHAAYERRRVAPAPPADARSKRRRLPDFDLLPLPEGCA